VGEFALALAAVAPAVADPTLREAMLQEALCAAREVVRYDPVEAAGLLLNIADSVSDPDPRDAVLREGIEVLRAVGSDVRRHIYVGLLALRLSEPEERDGVLKEAFESVRELDPINAIEVLRHLVPHLPEPMLGDALRISAEWEPEDRQIEILTVLAERVSSPEAREVCFHRALKLARTPPSGTLASAAQLTALAGLAEDPALRDAIFAEALTAAEHLRDDVPYVSHQRLHQISKVASHLPVPDERDSIFRRELQRAWCIEDASDRRARLSVLARYLPDHLLHEALETLRVRESPHARTILAAELVGYLTDPAAQARWAAEFLGGAPSPEESDLDCNLAVLNLSYNASVPLHDLYARWSASLQLARRAERRMQIVRFSLTGHWILSALAGESVLDPVLRSLSLIRRWWP
jgi:hypothetical protein